MAMDGTDGSVFGSAWGPAGVFASFRPRATRIPRAGVGKISRWEQARSVGPLVSFGPSPPASLAAPRAAPRDANARARTSGNRDEWWMRSAGEDSRGRSLTFAASAAESFVALNLYGCGWREAGRRPSACECEEMLGNDGAAGAVERAARTRAPRTRSGRTPGRGMNPRRGATGGSAGVARTRGGTRARRFARAQPPTTRVARAAVVFFIPASSGLGGARTSGRKQLKPSSRSGCPPRSSLTLRTTSGVSLLRAGRGGARLAGGV